MAYNVGVTRAKVEAGTAALVYDPTNTPNDLVRECQNMLKALKNNSVPIITLVLLMASMEQA